MLFCNGFFFHLVFETYYYVKNSILWIIFLMIHIISLYEDIPRGIFKPIQKFINYFLSQKK